MKNRIITSLFLLAAFCVAPVFAQEKSVSENQCRMLGKEDFVGEKIDVYVIDTEVREVLDYFTEQFDCDFVTDEKTAKIRVTFKTKDAPWNIALSSILKSKDLDLKQVNSTESKPLFSVESVSDFLEVEEPSDISGISSKHPKTKIDDLPLYTEIIQVKYITSKHFHNLKKYIERLISKRGKIEVNESTKTFIITDVLENLNSLKSIIEFVDDEDSYIATEEDK